jgi:hypothetical protein
VVIGEGEGQVDLCDSFNERLGKARDLVDVCRFARRADQLLDQTIPLRFA